MNLRTTTLSAAALAAGTLLALGAPLAASAHVSVDPASTAAGSYTVLTFSTAHGCDGSATTGITIDIPESILSVSPTVNPGWTVKKIDAQLDKPVDDESGTEVTTRVAQINYTAATPLPDGYRTTFELSLQLPENAEGEKLEFPVLQTCEVGETNWNEPTVEGEEEPELPAPFVAVTASTGGDGHSDATSDDAAGAGPDEADANASDAEPAADVLARVLGIGGLIVGAVGIVLAVTARRKESV